MTHSQNLRLASQSSRKTQRLAWLEGIRIFAAVVILLYHAQLLFTKYSYTPQPTGLISNLEKMVAASSELGETWLSHLGSLPVWFGFQFVDVFVLVSGFSLVLSLKGKPLEVGSFLRRRVLRILMPFWTIAWLSYPILWVVGKLTNSYIPDAWHGFASLTFPLLFDYGGDLLLPTSGPWWFVPLILSFALIFPVLWHLFQRWGARNLFIVSTVVTFLYRALAVFVFQGHPTYAIVDTPSGWQPFVPFIAKLSTFVVGMIAAQAYLHGKGAIFWKPSKALITGISIYALGFVCQFYRVGWIFVDFLLAIGLTLCCMVVFRFLSDRLRLAPLMTWLGLHSYSYFLIHNFVIDRTINLSVQDQFSAYAAALPIMIVETLVFAVMADAVTPRFQQFAIALWQWGDTQLTSSANSMQARNPRVGDKVCYLGQPGWTVINIEQVVHDQAFYLCRISKGEKTLWVNQNALEFDRKSQQSSVR
ncbi:MAG: acyltransferase [Myxacorys chilensis ATA2-1-KO14]|jgi:peptidoglycan/LPS O-acetylase OafA/YrhL|nr:acyltransferase [Myxacorys chilensis ATA2-1-KO14]